MSRILITGATGFTGGRLAERLRKDGAHVLAWVRPSSNTEQLENSGVEIATVDITDRDAVRRHFNDIDTVYHIAAAYRSEHVDRDEFQHVNVHATEHLLNAAGDKGISRFVHCSTVGVQGEIKEPPADEAYRVSPGDHYQESKLDGELVARRFMRSGVPVSVVRPVGIYGPGDTRFLKLFRPIARGHFVMIGSGDVLYHMTYIDDLVDGFLLAGTKQEAIGEIFTIAGPEYTTIEELVNAIAAIQDVPPPRFRVPFKPVFWASVVCDRVCRLIGVSPPLYPRRVEFFELDRAFNIAKAQRLLGYQPKVYLDDGLARTAAWYREQGLL